MTRPRLADLLTLPPMLDVKLAAAVLGVSADALYEALAAGEAPVPAIKIGRRLVVPTPGLLAAIGASVELLDALHRLGATAEPP